MDPPYSSVRLFTWSFRNWSNCNKYQSSYQHAFNVLHPACSSAACQHSAKQYGFLCHIAEDFARI